jgi:hypothetical protein
MDGAMPKTVLISLAAVVALIVIVILLGMRYLRADDDDDFDDDVPADHGRYPHDQARSRREHAPHDRFRQRQRATAGSRARPAGRVPGRVADERGWREDDGHAAGRGLLPHRDSRSARPGRRDRDDISEPAAASARRGYEDQDRAGARGEGDADAWLGRVQSPARDFERDRSDGRDDRDRFQARDGRDRRDARTVAGSREIAVADRDDRDRRAPSRSSQRPDGGRKNGVASDQDELLPAIKPRQSRNKHDADGDWPSNEWDELSDVDYWAELAADKPLTAPTPAEQAGRPRRGGSRSDASEPAVRDRDAGQAGRQARQRDAALQADRAMASTAARKLDPGPADRSDDVLGSGTHRASLGRTEQMHALPASAGRDGLQPQNPVPPDDDPLTSPSFPRIAADDSRSYRRSKRPAADASEHGGRARDGSTQPHSYPHHAVPRADNGTSYPGAGPGGSYISPSADPYAPVPTGNSVPSYPVPSSYVLPGGQPASGYPGDGSGYTGSADFGQNGYQSVASAPGGSYLPPPAQGVSSGYSGETVVRGSYQPPPSDHASFRQPADSGSYQSPPVGYPEAGPGGHLPAAAAAGYPISGDVTEYRADQADFGGAYPAYGDPGPSAFPQPHPDPGYLPPGGYGAEHDPAFHPSLHNGHMESGYPAYQAPAAAVNGSLYPPEGGQLPGPTAGYQDPYQPGAYDQPGYPSPVPQRGYAGADPYAADPYGYSGYGSGGR